MTPEYSKSRILTILDTTSDLFSQFSKEDLHHLLSFSNVEKYKKDQVILAEAEQNDRVFVLLEGEVGVYAEDEYILTLKKEGELFGEMSVITGYPTTALIKADSDVVLFTIFAQKINDSNERELKSMMYKIFLDILTQKLTITTNRVKGFQATSAELSVKKQELDQKSIILQSVLGSMSDGVVVIDVNGNLMHANRAFRNMVGNIELPEDLKQWPVVLGLYKNSSGTLEYEKGIPLKNIQSDIEINSKEIFVKNSNLTEGIWLHASTRALRSRAEGTIEGIVVVFTDYTAQKNQELALIEAKEHAEAIAKSKSDFLSVMSHELRTPLNGILGSTDLIKLSKSSAETADHIAVIQESGEKLLSLIKNILDYSNLESGDLKLAEKEYELEPSVQQKLKTYQPLAEKKGLTLDITFDKKLPKQLIGDGDRVTQIIEILLSNAIKFTHSGSITVNLSEKARDKNSVTIEGVVKDTGIGISAEEKEKLFKTFSQVDTAYSRKFEGIGLGLVLGQKLLALLGGNITVESQPEKGSNFQFYFKQKISSNLTQDRSEKSQVDKDTLNTEFSKSYPLNILVAEDNKINQKLLLKVLKKLGYEATIAGNGAEAFEICTQGTFDIILMDIQMPVMDGIEATEKIRAHFSGQGPKIIALTANVNAGVKEKCDQVGMNGYMSKPIRINQLAELFIQHSEAAPTLPSYN